MGRCSVASVRRTHQRRAPHRTHRCRTREDGRRAQWARLAQLRRALIAQRLRDVGGAANKSEAAIMRQGRWKSILVARRYIRAGSRWRDHAGAGIGL